MLGHHLGAKPVGSLNSVACVAPPVILGHVCQSAVDTGLRGDRVRQSGENFGDARRFQPVAHKTSRCPWTSTTCANHNCVVPTFMDLITCDPSRRNSSRKTKRSKKESKKQSQKMHLIRSFFFLQKIYIKSQKGEKTRWKKVRQKTLEKCKNNKEVRKK